MKATLIAILLLFASTSFAAEVAGVKVDDKMRVGASDLTLNGAGLRKRLFFQVYVIGLYLPQKSTSPAAILEQAGPKRVAIHMLRDVGADDFSSALADGIRANHSEAEAKALEPRVQQLGAIMAELKEAKKGMTINLDWTDAETQVVIQDKPAGKPIAGADFYKALLRIWLGEKPVQDDLKKALLGG